MITCMIQEAPPAVDAVPGITLRTNSPGSMIQRQQSTEPKVLIVSGSYGAGHDSAAREIAARLHPCGWEVDALDIADLYPLGLGHVMKRAYFAQLDVAPWSWGLILRTLDQRHGRTSPTPTGRAASFLTGRLATSRVARAIDPRTEFVVSTHPFASQALGDLRKRGLLDIPVVTYLTDASVHPLWVHRNVDLHLAVHESAAVEARQRGARTVSLISPLTPATPPATGNERSQFRADLGLPHNARIALVAGGSEGAGDILAAALDVRDNSAATPVVLCGRNERLRRRIEDIDGVVAVGWIDGLATAIRAADCVIQNSGGFTTLETLALGTPLISYRCLPGHGQSSARALQTEGLAVWPRTPLALGFAVQIALRKGHTGAPRAWSGRPALLDALPWTTPALLAG